MCRIDLGIMNSKESYEDEDSIELVYYWFLSDEPYFKLQLNDVGTAVI